jgi:hypothetical protein
MVLYLLQMAHVKKTCTDKQISKGGQLIGMSSRDPLLFPPSASHRHEPCMLFPVVSLCKAYLPPLMAALHYCDHYGLEGPHGDRDGSSRSESDWSMALVLEL